MKLLLCLVIALVVGAGLFGGGVLLGMRVARLRQEDVEWIERELRELKALLG